MTTLSLTTCGHVGVILPGDEAVGDGAVGLGAGWGGSGAAGSRQGLGAEGRMGGLGEWGRSRVLDFSGGLAPILQLAEKLMTIRLVVTTTIGLLALSSGAAWPDQVLNHGIIAGSVDRNGTIISYFSSRQEVIKLFLHEMETIPNQAQLADGLSEFGVVFFIHSIEAIEDGRLNPEIFSFVDSEQLAQLQQLATPNVWCDIFSASLDSQAEIAVIVSAPQASSADIEIADAKKCIIATLSALSGQRRHGKK